MTTKTKKLGFIAAKPIPQVLRNINAFTLGAQSVNPKITTQVIFTGDWSLPVKEAEAANSLIDQGVDVITCHVDSPKVVVETAERRGIYVCGYHANQAPLAPKGYLTGAEWNWLTPYTVHVKAAQEGKPFTNFLRGGLKEGFVKMSPYGKAVSEAGAQERRRRSKAEDDGRRIRDLQRAAEGQHRQGRHRRRQRKQTDDRARADELPGRGRRRQGLTPGACRPSSRRGRSFCGWFHGTLPYAPDPSRCVPRRLRRAAEAVLIPVGALLVAMVLFGAFMVLVGKDPLEVYSLIYKGGFSGGFAWQNTLQRAAPLILTALCVALPAQAGLIVIGGEGALVLGGLQRGGGRDPVPRLGLALADQIAMALVAMIAGGLWIALAGALRYYRGVNETISSLLLTYIAIALFNHFVEGPLRDPASLNKPSTPPIGEANMVGTIPGLDVHWGLAVADRLLRPVLCADAPHEVRLRRAHRRRQCPRGAGAGAAGRQG